MAIVRITRPPVTAQVYDAVNAKLEASGGPAEGLLVHSAGEVDGGWQIVDVWESEEQMGRFDQERLGPAIEAVSGPMPPEGRPPQTVYELHHLAMP